jgi:hypothetical protein
MPAAAAASRDPTAIRILQALESIEAHIAELAAGQRWAGAEWIPDDEAARRLGSTTGTLKWWRGRGRPALRFTRVGRVVMYAAADVAALLLSQARTCTAQDAPPDPTPAAVPGRRGPRRARGAVTS